MLGDIFKIIMRGDSRRFLPPFFAHLYFFPPFFAGFIAKKEKRVCEV